MRVYFIFHLYTNMNFIFSQYISIGSPFLSPALGLGGARATIITPLPEKFCSSVKQAGKKEGGLGEGIFARLFCRAKRGWGREAARPCVSKEAKPAKIVSLIEKIFCARPLKEKGIFAGFARRVATPSRWAGCRACGAALEVSIRIFAEKSSNFVQNTEPNCMFKESRLGASRLGGQICQYFPRIFERNKNLSLPQNAVRRAKHGANECLQPIFFLARKGELQSDNYPPKADCPKAI